MFDLRECRPMLPASNMSESLAFYRAIGFQATLFEPSVAALSQGAVGFLLKLTPSPAHAAIAPFMFVTVPCLTEWWIKIRLLDLGKRHRVRPPREPVLEPWGQLTGYLYDPSDVVWHFVEPAEAKDQRDRHRPAAHRPLDRGIREAA